MEPLQKRQPRDWPESRLTQRPNWPVLTGILRQATNGRALPCSLLLPYPHQPFPPASPQMHSSFPPFWGSLCGARNPPGGDPPLPHWAARGQTSRLALQRRRDVTNACGSRTALSLSLTLGLRRRRSGCGRIWRGEIRTCPG